MAKKRKISTPSVFVANLKRRRKELNWSQEFLAHKSGVALRTIKDIERGASPGLHATREALAQSVGCTLDELNQFEAPKVDKNVKRRAFLFEAGDFLARVANLSPEDQKVVFAVVYDDPDLL
jgi:transcriptional regulator with XRE-family HTH domain